ncbi:ABC transporter permease [Mesorhizobium sp. LMG 17147]|uniref:ABC transporter permease n=1 Tax=Mesorhizobium sp. LMG 17147 TaxID=2963091 RepID=UPI0020C9AA8C|nr:ABC transporter permease [Mesorhizobium sp. LMG 17147]MCP9231801.1 ABC transporter permease [Mesorhizobium sp. LMG 17147]
MTVTRLRLASVMPLLVLAGLCVAISIAEPRFLSIDNLIRIAAASAAPLVLALGATFVILMGSIDLSVEGSMAFASAILAACVANANGAGLDLGLAALPLVIAAAALFGALIGVIHTYLRVPSFMASLGMGFVGLGIATIMLGGERVGIVDESIRALALTRILNLPISIYVATFMLALAWVIQNHTRIGRRMLALGGAEQLVVASGVNVRHVRILVFAIAGAFFGVGAVLASARLGASSALVGSGQLFTAISAVVVGGTALTGGSGGVLATLLGVLIVMVLNNGMVILGLPTFVQQGVLGIMIIIAVLLNQPIRGLAVAK